MDEKIKEIQETLLWQNLNSQILSLKRRGKPVKDEYHDNLQQFCFNNFLFSRVTENPVILEIPLSLITDFQKVFIVTINLKSWTSLLTKLIRGTYALNIEKALAQSFDRMVDLDRKYGLVQTKDRNDDNDAELYKFIGSYTDAKDSIGMDIPSLILRSHRSKAKALTEIMKIMDVRSCLKFQDGKLFIDLSVLPEIGDDTATIQKVNKIYAEHFCKKADPHKRGNRVKWVMQMLQIQSMLSDKLEEENIKDSVESFVKNELRVFDAELSLIRSFADDIQHCLVAGIHSNVVICDTAPFFFLSNPLPFV